MGISGYQSAESAQNLCVLITLLPMNLNWLAIACKIYVNTQCIDLLYKHIHLYTHTHTHAHSHTRYFLRVVITRRLSDIVKELDVAVHTLSHFPEMNNSLKMEVGIEDCLHIEFEYNKAKWVNDKKQHRQSYACERCIPTQTWIGQRICGALVPFGCYQHRYEWKGLWCSSTVQLLLTQTWVNVKG